MSRISEIQNCASGPEGRQGACLHGTDRCTTHKDRGETRWAEDLDYEDLQRCVNLARNTPDADRWTAFEWLQLYACYKACTHYLTPDEWTDDQVHDALTAGVVPLFPQGDREKDDLLRCTACGVHEADTSEKTLFGGLCGSCDEKDNDLDLSPGEDGLTP